MHVKAIQLSPNILSITSFSPRYVTFGTSNYVSLCFFPLNVSGICGGNTPEKSIFRPLYVEPYIGGGGGRAITLDRALRGPFWIRPKRGPFGVLLGYFGVSRAVGSYRNCGVNQHPHSRLVTRPSAFFAAMFRSRSLGSDSDPRRSLA